MTLWADNLTSFILAAIFLTKGAIMFYEASQNVSRAKGGEITALSALIVGVIYAVPLVFDIHVVDTRGVLRISWIIYGGNYIISHHQSLFALLRGLRGRLKIWK